MSLPALEYQWAEHVEVRRVPPVLISRVFIGAVLLGLMVDIPGLLGVTVLLLAHRRLGWVVGLWLIAGPACGTAIGVVFATVHSRTQVFADRVDVSLYIAALRLWRKSVSLKAVNRCVVWSSPAAATVGVWRGRPGYRAVMFDGNGVCLGYGKSQQLVIGSSDPSALGAKIETARRGPSPSAFRRVLPDPVTPP